MRLDQAMHSVDEYGLGSTSRRFSDFLMASSFFYSNKSSGSMLSKNWRFCIMLAASACKSCMRLAASHRQFVPEWPPVACILYPRDRRPLGYNLHATGGHSGTSCFWLAARRKFYLHRLRHCVWPHLVTPVNSVRYNLILHIESGFSGNTPRIAAKSRLHVHNILFFLKKKQSATEWNASVKVY